MKKSTFIILGLVLLAGALTYSLLTGVVRPAPVVVARYDLAAGTRLTADVLEVRQIPKGGIPEGAYTALEEVAGKVLTTSRVAGDAITAYVAGENEVSAGIPAQLEPDTVAIAVKVDQATGLGGVLRPGQRVSVIAVLDPGGIQLANQMETTYSEPLVFREAEIVPVDGGWATVTPVPTATPQPPLSPAARITISSLRVLVVPQSFRYEEVPEVEGEEALFSSARTSMSAQSGSVVLLEVPIRPLEITPGLAASPAELLALLNQVATIHLALEPADGLAITVSSLNAIDLTELYEEITGYSLTP